MEREIDLLVNYPKTKRNLQDRFEKKTEEDRAIARKFGVEFFDGPRNQGYGGHYYHPRFWHPVVPNFQKHYQLTSESHILDIGCAKGFMLYDFTNLIPGITVQGIDISSYAIENAHPAVKPFLQVADARDLPFPDKSFDLVTSINTIHNFEGEDLLQSLREIERVSKGKSFVVVDAYRDEQEKDLLYRWNLTAKSILHVDEWKRIFAEIGYTGNYYWFVP
ncbi:MAG: class I SAM-dependent methyltransferase [Simkania sp.]|nr:class I SAM-dependent methyltransferase [Simkania sp.]